MRARACVQLKSRQNISITYLHFKCGADLHFPSSPPPSNANYFLFITEGSGTAAATRRCGAPELGEDVRKPLRTRCERNATISIQGVWQRADELRNAARLTYTVKLPPVVDFLRQILQNFLRREAKEKFSGERSADVALLYIDPDSLLRAKSGIS